VVDDTAANIDLLLDTLGEDYRVRVATDGEAALKSVGKAPPDLILLDVMMPGMDGFQVCRRLKATPAFRDIPVVFLTALSEDADEARGLALGAVDYIAKPFNPTIVKARVRNHLELEAHRGRLEELVERRTVELERTREAAIVSMALLAEYRDSETGRHIQRTKHYVLSLARTLSRRYPEELTPANMELLFQSAPLHDIGKVAIPDSILLKTDKLTDEEFAQIRLHTTIGAEVIGKAEAQLGSNSFLRMAREMAGLHHERWDGSGYPRGLQGEEIPLSARLMAIADVYDALTSRRPYKSPFSHEKAFRVITRGDGRTLPEHFCPVVLEAFREVHDQWMRIAERFSDDESFPTSGGTR